MLLSHNSIKADPERLQPLLNLPLPLNGKALQRTVGFFSYYSKFIRNYSEKIRPLLQCLTFPLHQQAKDAFKLLKNDIANAVVKTIDETIPFVVQTDASDFSLAAALNQNGQPVTFFSKSLNQHETHAIEKEAYAIVEALRKWKHYLAGRHFTLVIDLQAVSYMFNQNHQGKIKNDKIMRWRTELGCYSYDIQYRPGKYNQAADCLTRSSCSALLSNNESPLCSYIINNKEKLEELHNALCHPGITRMNHFVRRRNLPYSIEEIKSVVNQCITCCELKPRFYKPPSTHLIKATQPFERLNINFKGPLPTPTKNRYIFTIIDEYSRFPFAFPCPDTSSSSVIKCFKNLFSLFGMPAYVHSD